MRRDDYDEFRMTIRVLGASYETFIGDEHVSYFWSVLEAEPFSAVSDICNEFIRADHRRDDKMPSAHQLRRLIRQEQYQESRAIACQQSACTELVPWPPKEPGEHAYYCPMHQPEHDRPATPAEKRAVLMRMAPKARAFLRLALDRLMADIPITMEEESAAEELSFPRRPKAFEQTAEGPGVNPGVFLNGQVTEDSAWIDGYRKGADIMVAAGFKYDVHEAVWRRGKQRVSDEHIGRMDEEVLRMFVGRRS